MVAALIPFTASDLITLRQFGIGVAVAILLDVLVVRPVLLPAAEAVLGRAGWWPTSGGEARKPGATEKPTTVTAARAGQPSSAPS
jgi:RND superfamily putative drug exporter